jgi:hypothetical protein
VTAEARRGAPVKPGPKPRPESLTEQVQFRAAKDDLAAWRDAAERARVSLAEWIRLTLNGHVK